MADDTQLRKMLAATDLVIFAARRGDGCHAAIIHMRDFTKQEAREIFSRTANSAVRITHWTYSNDKGGITLGPER